VPRLVLGMSRRMFLGLPAYALLAAPRIVRGQPATKTARIVVLSSAAPPPSMLDALRAGLQQHGWIEGQNLSVEYRSTGGRDEKLDAVANAVARLDVDVVIALHTPAAVSARRAIRGTPLVVVSVVDPVAIGLVSALGRPGGNVTGTTFHMAEVAGKIVEIIGEALPGLSGLVVLGDSTFPGWPVYWKEAETVARVKRIKLTLIELRKPDDLPSAIATLRVERPKALYVVGTSAVAAHRERIIEFAARNRVPAIYSGRTFVDRGGLMSYGADVAALYRRAGYFVDRILKGAKPGELPVEQPTKFELVINLKTAKALGLTIPSSLILRADELIQ